MADNTIALKIFHRNVLHVRAL